ESGYHLHIATNGNAVKQWDKLIRLGIALYFENVFVSEEIGEEKGVSFFKKVLKKIKARPEECLIIGDKEEADIAPAKKLGMKTFRLRRGKYSKLPTVADFEALDLSKIFNILKR
ncbi:HAD hydrolase-like protein, partial [Candidatus Micrarchaeota archaeon]|nr:HAD hydrolase-like protein [Candidatus Micrarchaeota archaeon]